MIKPMMYCHVVSDKNMQGSGLHNGQILLVTGTKVAPIKQNDPYLQRIFVTAVKVDKDGTHHLPGEDSDAAIYVVDPRNLEPVNELTQKELEGQLVARYGGN